VEGLEARFNNKDGQPHSESTTHLYGFKQLLLHACQN
jgi:hypothetical protein